MVSLRMITSSTSWRLRQIWKLLKNARIRGDYLLMDLSALLYWKALCGRGGVCGRRADNPKRVSDAQSKQYLSALKKLKEGSCIAGAMEKSIYVTASFDMQSSMWPLLRGSRTRWKRALVDGET
ncbi:hypothetical protein PMIN06_002374 [Paraphaeosphaeria minitans]